MQLVDGGMNSSTITILNNDNRVRAGKHGVRSLKKMTSLMGFLSRCTRYFSFIVIIQCCWGRAGLPLECAMWLMPVIMKENISSVSDN